MTHNIHRAHAPREPLTSCGGVMFEHLCLMGKKVVFFVIVPGVLAGTLLTLASASFIACIAALINVFAVIFFLEDASDKNAETIDVAVYLVAAMAFFTIASILSGVPFMVTGVLVAMTGIVTYFAALFAQKYDSRCSAALLFIVLLPLGFLVVEALAWMSSRKKAG